MTVVPNFILISVVPNL